MRRITSECPLRRDAAQAASPAARRAPRWPRLSAAALLAAGLLGGCTLPPPQSPETAAAPPRAAPAPPEHEAAVLEENPIGEETAPTPAESPPASEPTPAFNAAALPPPGAPPPAAAPPAAAPSPAPQVAALEPGRPGPAPAAPPAPADALEPESLVKRIGANTPPNVAAALRLVEDGRALLQAGKTDQALDRFERSVAIDPTNAYGYYYLAKLHYLTKKYDQAIAFASRAITLSARSDPVWLARAYALQGAVFEDVGRYPDARKAYEKAVGADPNNLAARVGVARLNTGR